MSLIKYDIYSILLLVVNTGGVVELKKIWARESITIIELKIKLQTTLCIIILE